MSAKRFGNFTFGLSHSGDGSLSLTAPVVESSSLIDNITVQIPEKSCK